MKAEVFNVDDFYFDSQMARLSKQFGEKNFGSERKVMIWHHVKNQPNHWLGKLVDKIISSERYAPMPDFFADHARKSTGQLIQKSIDCDSCGGSGWVARIDGVGWFAKPCACLTGNALVESHKKAYYFNQEQN